MPLPFNDADMLVALEVCAFMMRLDEIDPVRYDKATEDSIPNGDLAYGMAVSHWRNNGKPKNAWFSYAPGQKECKLLLAFAKEIGDKFGLPILTIEEGMKRHREEQAKGVTVLDKKVVDWRVN